MTSKPRILPRMPTPVITLMLLSAALFITGLTLLALHLTNRPQCDSAPTIELVTQIAATQPFVLTRIINQQPDYVYRDVLLASVPLMGKLATYRLESINNSQEIYTDNALMCRANIIVSTRRYGEFIGQIQYVIDQSDNGQLVAAII